MLDLTSPTSPVPESRWTNQLPNSTQHNPTTPRTQVTRPKQRQISSTRPSLSTSNPTPPPFRNVSACNRCRLRKHRCDQRLPRCESCEKAGARCVGYDPLTKRELPRSYVSFLESRVGYLKQVLIDHNIDFKPATAYDEEETLRLGSGVGRETSPGAGLKDGIVARSSMSEQRDGSRRKRKMMSPVEEEEELPPRQMKRLCQLSLLLKDFFNDGCTRRHCDGEHDHEDEHEHREVAEANNHRDRVHDGPQQTQPWSPQSYESMEHSDNHTISGSESPEYPQRQYHALNSVNEISSFDGMFGSTRGPNVYGIDTQPRINLGPDLVDFEFDMPEAKPSFAVAGRNRSGNTARRCQSLSDKEQADADAKFDIGAELLRQRTEKANYDLLDEFLVGWRDSD